MFQKNSRTFLDNDRDKFCLSDETSGKVVSNSLCVSTSTFWGIFVWKVQNFQVILGRWAKSFGRSSKNFWRVVKSAFNVSKLTIWGSLLPLEKKFLFFFCGYSAQVFRVSVKNFSTKFSKQHSTRPKECLENLISEGNIYLQFRILIEIFPPFCRNFINGVIKNAFKMSRGTFWANRNFKLKRSF